ncbi:MAG: MSCRAMM family protein [Terriglobales bacterium]
MKRDQTAQVALALGLLLATAPGAAAQARRSAPHRSPRGGTITGVVINQRGQPVAGAKVSYRQLGVAYAMAIVYATSDRRGRFHFVNLDWGRYNVYAEKESAGYPDQRFTLYGAGLPLPLATLSPRHPKASVVVHVARAAVLTGTVTDAATGKPVSNLTVLLKEPVSGAWFSGTAEANLYVLIPPLVQVNVTLTAPGYRPWQRILRMRPGQRENITIKLAPSR